MCVAILNKCWVFLLSSLEFVKEPFCKKANSYTTCTDINSFIKTVLSELNSIWVGKKKSWATLLLLCNLIITHSWWLEAEAPEPDVPVFHLEAHTQSSWGTGPVHVLYQTCACSYHSESTPCIPGFTGHRNGRELSWGRRSANTGCLCILPQTLH